MVAGSDLTEQSPMTLHHLSDAELVRIFSCLGDVYRLSHAGSGSNGSSNDLQALAGVDRRFRSLVHTQVVKTLLFDCPDSFTWPSHCPRSAANLIRSCTAICVSASAAAVLRQFRFLEPIIHGASRLTSLSIYGGQIRRSELQLLCGAPWPLESLCLQQCSIQIDTDNCLLSDAPPTLRSLDLLGSVVVDVNNPEWSAGRSCHLPPLFFADLPVKAPRLESLVLPPLRYQFPTRLLKDLVPSGLLAAGTDRDLLMHGRHADDFLLSEPPIQLDGSMDSLQEGSSSDSPFSFHLPHVIVCHQSHLTRLEVSLHSTYHTINIARTDAVGLIRPSEQEFQRSSTALFSSMPSLRHLHVCAHPRHQIRLRLDAVTTCSHLTHLSLSRCMLSKDAQQDLAHVGTMLGALRTLRLTECQVHTPHALNGHGGNVGVAASSSILGVLPQLTSLEHLCLQDLAEVVWVAQPSRGGWSVSEISSLTALTALHLVPVQWPEVAQQWLEWPLSSLTNLRHLSLPSPFAPPACMDQRCLLGVFACLNHLESVNCMGLKATVAEVNAILNTSLAPVWTNLNNSLGGEHAPTPHVKIPQVYDVYWDP